MDWLLCKLLFLASFVVIVQNIQISSPDELSACYDYIVVGAGIGGLVVANRLSEDPSINILLLEAGPLDDYGEDVKVPGHIGFEFASRYDWNLTTVAQTAIGVGVLQIAQGKVVGGSSILNGLCWTRGSRADYDAWKQLGNPGWGWDDLVPYFLKAENYSIDVNPPIQGTLGIHPDLTLHGNKGPVSVAYPQYFYMNQSVGFLEGIQQLGIPLNGDVNAGVAAGASVIPSSMLSIDQSRADARTAYWDSIYERRNLHLFTGQTVTRLLHKQVPVQNSLHVSVDGVEFAARPTALRIQVRCSREVILSAGAIFSPILLQISGFGPSDVLTHLGVPIAVDLPGVGRNLQDHPMVQVLYNYTAPTLISALDVNANRSLSAQSRQEYYHNRTGPYTAPEVNVVAFPALQWIMNDTQRRGYLERIAPPPYFLSDSYDETLRAGYAAQYSLLLGILQGNESAAYELMSTSWGQLSVSSMQPFSRGVVEAVSSSIFNNTPPHIDPRYCANPADCDIIAYGLQLNDRLIRTDPMRPLWPVEDPNFGPEVLGNWTALQQALRKAVGTEYHPSGTTAMMPRNSGGVVDPSLKVYGTTNLRVVDAGIIPMIPGAHIQAAIYAIAEKAADIIKAEDLAVPFVPSHLPPGNHQSRRRDD